MDDFYDDDDCYDMEDEEEDEDQVTVATFHHLNPNNLVHISQCFFFHKLHYRFWKLTDVKLFNFRMSTTRNRVPEVESWKVLKVKIEAKKISSIFPGFNNFWLNVAQTHIRYDHCSFKTGRIIFFVFDDKL